MPLDLNLDVNPAPPARADFKIGVVGSGFIVRDIQLVAYKNAGFKVVAIASLNPETAKQVAALRGVPAVYANYRDLLRDPSIEILDVAVPPDLQLAVVREAVSHAGHLKGILCQKPLAVTYRMPKRLSAFAVTPISSWA